METSYRGIWSPEQVSKFLENARIPVRLGCVTESGFPLVVSLWFDQREGDLWCATQASAKVVRTLEREPRCGFEVGTDQPPYAGVRGQAVAELDASQGPEVLERLIERYVDDPRGSFARWLRSRNETEVAIRLRPRWVFSWDFAKRMSAPRKEGG